MRTVILLISLSVLLVSPVLAEDRVKHAQDAFSRAVEAYKKGDYEQAVRLNQEALATGVESTAIHYNLGNSYLRTRQIGHALASYLRALRLAPRDADIKANLGYVRSLVNGPLPGAERPFWALPFGMVSVNELRWGVLFIFMLAAAVVLFGLYAGQKSRKIAAWAVLAGLLWGYVMIGLFTRAVEESGRGVALERTDVRFEPSAQATVYFKLLEGTEVRVLREKDGWLKIERFDHKTGWLPAATVEKI